MRVAGLMSGTSVDGIDVVIAEIVGEPNAIGASALAMQQLAFATIPWPAAIRETIFSLFHTPNPAALLCRANFAVAEHFAAALHQVCDQVALPLATIDLIGSHGQTIWHDVANGHVTSTLQIGDPSVIAARTGITTVGNLRVADVAVGGQGAPLVSAFDWHLLRPSPGLNGSEDGWRAVQNIGGIGNVTLLPPQTVTAAPIAFDTGPGNVFIDWGAQMATDGALSFDIDGQLAATGTVVPALLTAWLQLPYFQQPPPKTTGRELFHPQLAETWWLAAQAAGLRPADFVATVTALTATTIADAYARYAPAPLAQVVLGGGGARNPVLRQFLTQALTERLGHPVELCTHTALGIDDKAKEALAFALLAYLAVHGYPGNVPACTGASRPQRLGQIAPGDNFQQVLLHRAS